MPVNGGNCRLMDECIWKSPQRVRGARSISRNGFMLIAGIMIGFRLLIGVMIAGSSPCNGVARDTLAVQLTLPLAGYVRDFHPPVIHLATTASRIAPARRLRAMPGALIKKRAP